METNSDPTPGSKLPPGPVVESKSRGGMWLFVALVLVAALIYLAKVMA